MLSLWHRTIKLFHHVWYLNMQPEFIGKYRVEKRLGTGAFATVYLCFDPDLESQCAIKVLSGELSEEEHAQRWFLNEARLMFGLHHPNIVRVFTTGRLDDGRPYFVMEHASGGSLSSRTAELLDGGERYSVEEALKILLAIGQGLQVAHGRGIVHRDLKPSNILFVRESGLVGPNLKLDVDEQVKIADFGIARTLEDGTRSLAGVGTPYYMAPEQARAGEDDRPDPRSDVYAAAAILYELLSGRAPFPYSSLIRIVHAHLLEAPPPIQSLAPNVPDAVAFLVHAGLQKDLEARIESAEQLVSLTEMALSNLAPEHSVRPAGTPFRPANDASRNSSAEQETIAVSAVAGSHDAERPDLAATAVAGSVDGTSSRFPQRPFDRSLSGERRRERGLSLIGMAGVGVLVASMLSFVLFGGDLLGSSGSDEANGSAVINGASDDDVAGADLADDLVSTDDLVDEPEPTPPPPVETDDQAGDSDDRDDAEADPTPVPVTASAIEEIESALAVLPGNAGAVVVLPDGQRVEQNSDRQVPAASLIKLWIAATLVEDADGGVIDIREAHTIQGSEQVPGTGRLNQSQFVGSSWEYAELLEIMLLYSDNTAANIILDRVGGMDRINQYATEWGYNETLMQRRLGDLDPSRENYTSARDVALYLERMTIGNSRYEVDSLSIADVLERRRLFEPETLNFFGRDLPASVEYGHLSGLLPNVRNEAGLFRRSEDGSPVIVVLLIDGLADDASGEATIATTVRAIYDAVP